jgi:hypothetical protein
MSEHREASEALLAALEKYCVQRRRDALKRGIRALLSDHPDDLELRYRALDWFWRAGLQREGLKCALPSGRSAGGDITPARLGNQRSLWLMMFVIGQSGWPYAWRWLPEVRAETEVEKGLLGQVLMDLGDYGRAFELLSSLTGMARQQVSVTLLMTAWRGGYHREGLVIASEFLGQLKKQEWVTRWWVGLIKAYFEGCLASPAVALKEFQAWDQEFPEAPLKAPRLYAISRIWKGLLARNAAGSDLAREEFERAEEWYLKKVSDYVPLRLLDLYFWKDQAGLLSDAEREVILNYPGPPPYVRSLRNRLRNAVPPPGIDPQVQWLIRPKSDEYRFQDRLMLGIPLEIRLLAILRRAGRLGIHRNLAKALLWPEEIRIFFALDGRLSKLIERLREVHGFRVITDKDCFFLDASDRTQVAVDTAPRAPEFLLERSGREFAWEDLSRYYSIGATQSRAMLRSWLESGRIRKVGSGRFTRYIGEPEK